MSDEELPQSDDVLKALIGFAKPSELIPIPAFNYAEPGEFEASLSPAAALDRLQLDKALAVTQLHRELAVNRVIGIAEQAVWRRDGQNSNSYFLIVPTWFWSFDVPTDSDFWATGYRERGFPATGYSVTHENWIKLYAVRFWFPGLATSAPQVQMSRTSLPDLSKSDAEKFSRAILAGWPQCTEADAYSKASLFFPDHKVSRDWFLKIFRVIRGPKKPGKSPKMGN